MKHIKKFNESEENFDSEFDQLEEDVKNFISESGLDADYELDRDGPTLFFYVKKTNKCFNSESLKSQFSNDMGFYTDGMSEGGFMSSYTTLDDMYGQIRVIESISNSLEDLNMRNQRIYISNDDSICIEMMPNI